MTGSNYGMFTPDGRINADAVKTLTRTYAQAIAGEPVAMTFDAADSAFTLTYLVDKVGEKWHGRCWNGTQGNAHGPVLIFLFLFLSPVHCAADGNLCQCRGTL